MQGKDITNIKNYRPITISSILSRVYWVIVDRKLRTHVQFTPRHSWYLDDPNIISKDRVKLPIAPADSTIRYMGGVFAMEGTNSRWSNNPVRGDTTTRAETPPQATSESPSNHNIFDPPLPVYSGSYYDSHDNNKEDGPRVTYIDSDHISPTTMYDQWSTILQKKRMGGRESQN
jgi:hypothetical protein